MILLNIESKLPENFEELSPEEKVDELESLKDEFQEDTDSGSLKKRMVEELIRKYNEDN